MSPARTASPDARASPLVPIVIGTALFIYTFDFAAFVTLLPSIAASLAVEPLALTTALTAHLVGGAAILPVAGWAADRLGARRVFVAAILAFAAGLVVSVTAMDLWVLAAARMLQGAAGAVLLPVGRVLLLQGLDKAHMVRALSTLTIPALVGPALGPPLAGWIAESHSWRWAFLLLLPVIVVGLGMVMKVVPQGGGDGGGRNFDYRGFILSAVALISVVFGVDAAVTGRASAGLLTTLAAVALVSVALYWRHAGGAGHPILDLRLLRIGTFARANLGGAFTRMLLTAAPVLMSLQFQTRLGLSPSRTGLLISATAVGAIAMKIATEPLIRVMGFRRLLLVNGSAMTASFVAFALIDERTPLALAAGLTMAFGIFRSLQLTALGALGFADLEASNLGAGATLAGVIQQLSQSAGVALATLALALAAAAGADARLAFVAVGLIALAGAPFFIGLAGDAGEHVSGRIAPQARKERIE